MKIETIDVVVTGVTWPKEEFPEDGSLHKVIMRTKTYACLGKVTFWPKPGMVLKLTGSKSVWNGMLQFNFTKVAHDVPVDPRSLLDYAAEMSKGVGPATCDKLWEQYGETWRDHLDEMPQKIGIALKRTLATFDANKHQTECVTFVLKHGGTIRMANEAWKKWKDQAIPSIEANPYILASLPGVGFKTVDERMGASFGIGKRDLRRAVAAVDYAMRSLLDESGCSVVRRDALYDAMKGLDVDGATAQVALSRLVTKGRIEFVGFEHVTLNEVVRNEGDIARYIADKTKASDITFDPSEVKAAFTPDESQMDAIRAAVEHHGLTIVNGGAGCGKTTIIKVIADILRAHGDQVDLCAFAGKAAARLREATGYPASTVHSLLGWSGEGVGFTLGNLHGASVILDESSMVPSSLLYEITKRDPDRLILVGDQAQLQPVGIGAPFHDCIDRLAKTVHTVTTCYRNKEAVFQAAAVVREGGAPGNGKSREEEFEIRRVKSAEEAHEKILDLVRSGVVEFDQDLVLSPRNGEGDDPTAASVKALNRDIQAIVNPHGPKEKFKAGDRVMCVKNFRDLDIWNGTTGFISRIDIDGKPYFKTDEGAEVRLTDKDHFDNIVPAYCLTVHKSQGSQYRNVYIVCLKRDEARLFDRSMLYTAITRAKHGCYIYTDEGLHRIVGSVRRRKTYLQMLMDGEA